MRALPSAVDAILSMEEASRRRSPIHELDSRAKVLLTLFFVALVASFPRQATSRLLPFFLFPFLIASAAGIGLRFVARRLLAPLPFVLLLALPLPLLEREPAAALLGLPVSGGLLALTSILLRYVLTASAAVILVATTGVAGIASALRSFHVPRAFATQLLVLFRYLFVLADEALRMDRGRRQRSFSARRMRLSLAGPFLGTLLLRSWDRADRVHRAMKARGFDGYLPDPRPARFAAREALLVLGGAALLVFFRLADVPALVARALPGGTA